MTTPADDNAKVPVQFLVRGDLKRAMEAAARLHDMTVTSWLIHVIWDALPVTVGAALELDRLAEIKRMHQARLNE